jgi:hypothetical protein
MCTCASIQPGNTVSHAGRINGLPSRQNDNLLALDHDARIVQRAALAIEHCARGNDDAFAWSDLGRQWLRRGTGAQNEEAK